MLLSQTENLRNNLTEGSILKSILILAVPIVFANLFQTAYNLVDTFWVGRLGAGAIAAVSLSFPIIFLLVSLGGGLTVAGTILVAQYKGKKEFKNVDYVAAQTFLMVGLVSAVLTVIGYGLSPFLIKLMNVEPAVFKDAVSYLRISFLGIIFLFSFFAFQSLMRGVGDVKTPLYIVVGTVVLNLFLDPLFIFGFKFIPPLGVAGAALATIITQGLSAIVGLIILFSGRYGIRLKKKNLVFDFKLMKKIFNLGFPASIEQSSRSMGILVLTFLVTSFGTVVIASFGIGMRLLSFIIIPALGFSMANSTLVGQNIGAGEIDRAEKISKVSMKIGFISLTFLGLGFFIFARQIIGFFIPNDSAVIVMGVHLVRIMALSFGFIALQQILNGTFRGSGNTLVAMIITIVSFWVLRFPLAYILSKHTPLSYVGVWWSFPVSNVLAFLIAFIWFKKGSWKKKRITEEFKLAEEAAEEIIIEEGL